MPQKVKRARPMRRPDFARILAAAPDTRIGHRDRALLAVMRQTGIRSGEAARLRRCDVDRQPAGGALLTLGATKTDPHDRRRARPWIDADVLDLVEKWLAVDGDRDPEERLFGCWTADGIRRAIKRAGERAGVEGLSGHSPRRGGAQDLLENGASLIELQAWGRWSTLAMPVRYTDEAGRGHALPGPPECLSPNRAAVGSPDVDEEPPSRRRRSRTMRIILDH